MKNNSAAKSPRRKQKRQSDRITIGMDLGDKTSRYCVLNEAAKCSGAQRGDHEERNAAGVWAIRRCRIAIEVGAHSPWVSRLLSGWGTK